MRAEHLIITGGSGYIGSRLAELALADGRSVTLLGRRDGPAGTHRIAWSLGDPFPSEACRTNLPLNRQAIVHCAHAWDLGDAGDAENVESSVRLLNGARAAGIGSCVFVSSQSAREDAPNRYGRIKWAIEQRLPGATSLRVGLVYGGPRQAMYGLLCRLTTLSPVLPMLSPGQLVQPIHRDEVAGGIFAAADRRAKGVLALAGAPVAFGAFLRLLARAYAGRRLRIIPIPLRAALLACDVSKRLPVIPTIDRERVYGLAGTQPIDSDADLARLGVQLRPLAQGLAAEPDGRRALLAEGALFLRHAIGRKPTAAALRRYARFFQDGAIVRPLLWRLEPFCANAELTRRLRLAARIAEATPGSEIALASGTRIGRLGRLALSMMGEAALLPLRLVGGLAPKRS